MKNISRLFSADEIDMAEAVYNIDNRKEPFTNVEISLARIVCQDEQLLADVHGYAMIPKTLCNDYLMRQIVYDANTIQG